MPSRICRWLSLALFGLMLPLLGAEAPRVAVVDFNLAGAVGQRDLSITNFSRDVQLQLLVKADFQWIERQELDRNSARG
jgi:hypothetical protein